MGYKPWEDRWWKIEFFSHFSWSNSYISLNTQYTRVQGDWKQPYTLEELHKQAVERFNLELL